MNPPVARVGLLFKKHDPRVPSILTELIPWLEARGAEVFLDEALAVRGPVLIEAVVDPYEPPMPPAVTMDQAAKFAESLARGEPNRKKIALTVLEDKVREMV